jgi:uncharacterized protein (DUF302 family)
VESYGRRVVVDLPFVIALEELTQALADEGLTILGRTDVRQYLDRTTHHDFRRYALLEAALPEVVLAALQYDLAVGAILPTTIAVFELADGETATVVAEPFSALGSHAQWRRDRPELALLADRTCDHLARALTGLEEAARTHASLRAG